MPFDSAPVPMFDPDGKLKYNLDTGAGRLSYLADQLEASRPINFYMPNPRSCAIGCAQRMKELVDRGLPDYYSHRSGEFFGMKYDSNDFDHLFGGTERSIDQEVSVIRNYVARHGHKKRLTKVLA